MTLDINKVRSRFPSLHYSDDGKRRIYFDNPGGTQVPQAVVDSMSQCLLAANANLGGYFGTSVKADAVMDAARDAMADLLNAPSSDQIVMGQNMTSLTFSMSRAIGNYLRPGDEIILSRMCHDANVSPWTMMAKERDLKVKWLEFDEQTFEYELSRLEGLLTPRTRLVCIGGASNLTGTLHDLESVCRMARDAGAWTYIDAVQSVPHVSTDVQKIGCDFLLCSSYKFFGPHQGIMYLRRECAERLVPYKVRPAANELPWSYETGTLSHEGAAGITAAVDYFAWIGEEMAQNFHANYAGFAGRRKIVHAAMDCLFDYEKDIALHLITGLQVLPGVKIWGITDADAMDRRVPTVSFTVEGQDPKQIAKDLAAENIFVWHGHNYALEAAETLGIVGKKGSVRIGPVHYNTIDEVEELLIVLDRILKSRSAA